MYCMVPLTHIGKMLNNFKVKPQVDKLYFLYQTSLLKVFFALFVYFCFCEDFFVKRTLEIVVFMGLFLPCNTFTELVQHYL